MLVTDKMISLGIQSRWLFWVALNEAAWISNKPQPMVAAAGFFGLFVVVFKLPILDMVALSILLGLKWYLLGQFSPNVFLCHISVLYPNYCPFLKAGIWKLGSQELTVVFYASVMSSLPWGNSVECLDDWMKEGLEVEENTVNEKHISYFIKLSFHSHTMLLAGLQRITLGEHLVPSHCPGFIQSHPILQPKPTSVTLHLHVSLCLWCLLCQLLIIRYSLAASESPYKLLHRLAYRFIYY